MSTADGSIERVLVGEIVAVLVGDRDSEGTSGVIARRKDRIGTLRADMNVAADVAQRHVTHEHARQQAAFGEDLKAVADAEHSHARLRPLDDRAHHRRMRGHGAGAQVVAVGKASGKDDEVAVRQIAVAVPDHARCPACRGFDGHGGVMVAVRTGEDDNARPHASSSS